MSNFQNTKPHEKTTNSLKRIEEYDTNILPKTSNLQENGQLLKKTKNGPPHPPFQPYRIRYNIARQEEKPVQSRHSIQAIPLINCTGPTLHTAESHKENI